ncbi:MAG: NAD(P)-dependent oxidoreductase [Chloroflexi bacterium]|nr:NAD(P)-dependent oxidoreductase [Chloroflexota bacterium]
MKILVTGGAGYLGSILVPELLRGGHEVTVLDSFLYGQSSLLDVCYDPKLTICRGDARDKELLRRLLPGQDLIVPLAALVGAPLCALRPMEAETTNVGAIELLLELRHRGQKIIYPNTNSGYGIGAEGIACTEETPLNPISLYGRTKCEAERLILDAGNSITLRLATVFGVSPRMRLDLLVNDFTYRAATDGFVVLFEAHFKRNYIHVRDVAAAFCHGINNFERMQGEPYNVGLSSANLSKAELCERIKVQAPRFYYTEAKVGEDPDKRNYIVSNAKIEATGFMPKYTIDAGIRELLTAYQIIKRSEFANV